MIKKRNFIVLAAFLYSCLAAPGMAFAADVNYTIKTNYTIAEDNSVAARTIIEVENTNQTELPDTLSIPVAGEEVSIKEAAFDDGAEAKVTYNDESNSLELKTDSTPSSSTWSVTVRYGVNIAKKLGKTTIFQVAPQTYGDLHVASQTTTLAAALELGLAKPRGPEPTSTTTVADQQIFTWVSEGAQTDAVGLIYGELGVASMEFSSELTNNGWWWKTVEFALPPDTNQQQVFLESISPAPSSLRLDTDGNVVASYSLRPRQSITVTAQAKIAVNNYSYTLTETATESEIPAEIKDQYTSLNDTWKQGEDIPVKEGQPVIDMIRTTYDAVTKKLELQPLSFDNSKQNADSLVGSLRALGIPARTVLGKVFSDGGKLLSEAQSHAWVEVYSPGVGWMTLDPTFETRGSHFGVADVTHVGLVLRGIDSDYPPSLIENAKVTYLEDQDPPEIPEMKPELRSTNYMVLPGLALSQVTTKMPAGVIVDGTAIAQDGQGVQRLGSLAPLQTVNTRKLLLGGSAFAKPAVSYGVAGESDSEIGTLLAETSTTTSYLPMIVLISIVALFVIVKLIRRKRKNRSQSKQSAPITDEDGEITEDDPDEGNILDEDDSLNNLIMTFDDEKEAQAPTQPQPGVPPYIHLSGKPQEDTKPTSVTNKQKSDIIPKTDTAAKTIPVKGLTPQPPRRRKPPRLIQ